MRAAPAVLLLAVFFGGCDTRVKVPVVSTWRQLASLKPIKLEDGVTVQLGLQARECPLGGGVLLYCLAEGYEPDRSGSGSGRRLGPLEIIATGSQMLSDMKGMKETQSVGERALYVKALVPRKAGPSFYEVRTTKGKVIARVGIRGTHAFYHPWMPWERPSPLETLQKSKIPRCSVTMKSRGRALPYWDGMTPILLSELRKTTQRSGRNYQRLPVHVPTSPTPGFQLTREKEDSFKVSSEVKMTLSRAREYFLTRWRINGRPFIPDPSPNYALSESWSGRVIEGNALIFDVDFDPEVLGARRGDRVGLQLLYCGNGFVEHHDHIEILMLSRGNTPYPVMMSNEIEFVIK